MKDKILAKRYSTAFFKNLSEEQFNQLLKDVKILYGLISEYPELISILHSPITDDTKKEEIVKNISELLNLSNKWYLFIKLLIKKNRIVIFSMILEELEKIVYGVLDKVKVKIVLAQKESSSIIGKIEAKVTEIVGKTVVSEMAMDPSIIGGFVAQTESLRIDGSIKGNFIRLQKIIQE